MMKSMKNASALLLAGVAVLSAGLAQAQSGEIKSLKLAAPSVAVNTGASLRVEFTPAANASACGVTVDWGNGAKQDIRLGIDSFKDSPATLSQAYPNPGSYNIKLEGKFLTRGLRSAAACTVSAAPVTIKVTDPAAEKLVADQRAAQLAAEAALKEAAIREQEAAARERAALADAERAKQDLVRQQAAAREMELDLKRKELERREAQLRKDDEARRAAMARPAAPAPAPAAAAAAPARAPAPAAPAGGRPPVKAADGF
jgi:hypothetical protein